MLIKYFYTTYNNYVLDCKNKIVLAPIINLYIEENIKLLNNNTLIYTNLKEIITDNNKDNYTDDYKDNNKDNCKNDINLCERLPIQYKYEIPTNITIKQKYIYKSIYSFDQNNIYLGNLIRNYIISNIIKNNQNIINNITTINFIGIGGEYYLYACIISYFKYYNKYYGITNNYHIYSDAEFNLQRFKIKNYINECITTYNNIDTSFINKCILDDINTNITNSILFDIIINLAKLNINVINFINIMEPNINNLTIISCKEYDFNNKKKYFSNTIINKLITKVFTDKISQQTITIYTYFK